MAGAVALAMAVSAEVPQIIAHRGGSAEQDENTLGAIKNSFAKGVRGFEVDVRLTKDRRVVLLHDDTLERTTDGKGRVEELTAAELAPVRTKKSGQPLPYLEEVFDFLKDKEGAFVQVEVKCKDYGEADTAELCRIMSKQVSERIDPAKVVFICFETNALQTLKALNPKQPTCLVSSTVSPELIKTAKSIGAEYLSVQLNNLYRAFVKDAHQAGLKLTTWTVKNAEDARLAILMGTDYVTTDIPVAQIRQKSARP